MDKTLCISFVIWFYLVITNQFHVFEVNILPADNWHFQDAVTLKLISQKQRIVSEFFAPFGKLVGKKYTFIHTSETVKKLLCFIQFLNYLQNIYNLIITKPCRKINSYRVFIFVRGA